MRIYRLLISLAAAGALLAVLAGNAAADAGCVGTFASSYGAPGFGQFVAEGAHEVQPLGYNLVGPAASSNDCGAFPTP